MAARRGKARGKKGKKKIVRVTIDLDQLERLYRRLHKMFEDGDTKGGKRERRFRLDADGDTKGGARARLRKLGDGKDGDGDTKGGAVSRRKRSRNRPDGDGDTKG